MIKHWILEQYVLIKAEPIVFQKDIFFHHKKLFLILKNVICNLFLFTFLICHKLRKERMEKGQGDNTVAKVVPPFVSLCKLCFFYLFKVHVVVFHNKSVLLLFFLQKLAENLNVLDAVYSLRVVFKVHAFSTLAQTLMFFIYIFPLNFSMFSFRFTATVTSQSLFIVL